MFTCSDGSITNEADCGVAHYCTDTTDLTHGIFTGVYKNTPGFCRYVYKNPKPWDQAPRTSCPFGFNAVCSFVTLGYICLFHFPFLDFRLDLYLFFGWIKFERLFDFSFRSFFMKLFH